MRIWESRRATTSFQPVWPDTMRHRLAASTLASRSMLVIKAHTKSTTCSGKCVSILSCKAVAAKTSFTLAAAASRPSRNTRGTSGGGVPIVSSTAQRCSGVSSSWIGNPILSASHTSADGNWRSQSTSFVPSITCTSRQSWRLRRCSIHSACASAFHVCGQSLLPERGVTNTKADSIRTSSGD